MIICQHFLNLLQNKQTITVLNSSIFGYKYSLVLLLEIRDITAKKVYNT